MTDPSPSEPGGAPGAEQFTVASSPPDSNGPQRRSRWAQVFAECRESPNEWRMVSWSFSKSSATQLASDIRNGHRRAPSKARVQGIEPADRFETRIAPVSLNIDDVIVERWFMWLRWLGREGGHRGHVVTPEGSPRPRCQHRAPGHLHSVTTEPSDPGYEQTVEWRVNPDTDRVERIIRFRAVEREAQSTDGEATH